jgi:DNA-binding response OmpR family regulator
LHRWELVVAERRLLLVEDEKDLAVSLRDRLEAEGYECEISYDGVTGEERARNGDFDCIILDVMMPRRDGFQVVDNLRRDGIKVPVIFLTARSTSLDTVMGLRLGGDDYMVKPFDAAVLIARIDALIRRAERANEEAPDHGSDGTMRTGEAPEATAGGHDVYRFGAFRLDRTTRALVGPNGPVELSAQEHRFLEFLVMHPDRVFERNELLDQVWGYDREVSTRTIDVHVVRLREKLGEKEHPLHIRTVRGFGYRFVYG